MADQYSLVRFWRFIFTPLIILTGVWGMFVLFSLSNGQLVPSISPLSIPSLKAT